MVLNFLLMAGLLAFQQVFNISMFVTKTGPYSVLTMVIHTFEKAGIFYWYTR
jgi:hypothetical protein